LARAADELCQTLWYADERFFRDCYTALMFAGRRRAVFDWERASPTVLTPPSDYGCVNRQP
jgi:hypothetical protein